MVRLRLKHNAETSFFETCRRLAEAHADSTPGLVSIVVARELSEGHTDGIIITVWDSVPKMRAAAGGEMERPMFPDELEHLVQVSTLSHYEVALYWDHSRAGPEPIARPR
jgi:hypothetical protein